MLSRSGARGRTVPAALLALMMVVASAGPADAGTGASGNFDNGSVAGTGHVRDPASGIWTDVPVGIPDDPYGYDFEVLCWDGDAGDLDCFAGLGISCTAADGGMAVQWYRGLKAAARPTWRPFGGPSCVYSEDPADVTQQIREVILSEFQRQPIAASTLTLQPGPHSLVGTHTNMFVDAAEQVFEMTLLGQDLRIIATPTEFEWFYGDGTSFGPSPHPGSPLPEDRWGEPTATSHVYAATGDYPVSVTTHFSGRYSVNGGPMIPIDGRAVVATPAQTLSIWRSESRNVADDCIVNPAGVGC